MRATRLRGTLPVDAYVNQDELVAREIYPGIRKRVLWQGANGAKAQVLEIDPAEKIGGAFTARSSARNNLKTGTGQTMVVVAQLPNCRFFVTLRITRSCLSFRIGVTPRGARRKDA